MDGAEFYGVGGDSILDQTRTGNISQTQLEDYNTSVQVSDGFRNSALITIVGAGVLGAAGIVTYSYDLQRPTDDTPPPTNTVAFSFTLAPSSAGLAVNGRF